MKIYLPAAFLFSFFLLGSPARADMEMDYPNCDKLKGGFDSIAKVEAKVDSWTKVYDQALDGIKAYKSTCAAYMAGNDQQKAAAIQGVTKARDKVGSQLNELKVVSTQAKDTFSKYASFMMGLEEKSGCTDELKKNLQKAVTGYDYVQREGTAALSGCK
jgi:vacuolar-type H+-ATPase subunit I/STV1